MELILETHCSSGICAELQAASQGALTAELICEIPVVKWNRGVLGNAELQQYFSFVGVGKRVRERRAKALVPVRTLYGCSGVLLHHLRRRHRSSSIYGDRFRPVREPNAEILLYTCVVWNDHKRESPGARNRALEVRCIQNGKCAVGTAA